MDLARNSNLKQLDINYSIKNERKLLKAILLSHTHHFVYDLFNRCLTGVKKKDFYMESYVMDSKILQLLIKGIVDTGEYTLEGIAFHTNIPFDVIYDAACGINYHLSVTAWAKVVDLYMQVKPDIAQILYERLQLMVEKKSLSLSSLSNESA